MVSERTAAVHEVTRGTRNWLRDVPRSERRGPSQRWLRYPD
jgi:hypothetical protein